MLGEEYKYPEWSIKVGWALTCSSVFCIPLYVIYKFCFASEGDCRRRYRNSFKPETNYGSVVPGQQGTTVWHHNNKQHHKDDKNKKKSSSNILVCNDLKIEKVYSPTKTTTVTTTTTLLTNNSLYLNNTSYYQKYNTNDFYINELEQQQLKLKDKENLKFNMAQINDISFNFGLKQTTQQSIYNHNVKNLYENVSNCRRNCKIGKNTSCNNDKCNCNLDDYDDYDDDFGYIDNESCNIDNRNCNIDNRNCNVYNECCNIDKNGCNVYDMKTNCKLNVEPQEQSAEDNNYTMILSSCKPLKFSFASEWLV